MQTIEYRTADKSSWGNGPWSDEPDKKQWQDEFTGLPCLAVRGPGGHWCGYVGVVQGHPVHSKDYSDTIPWRPEFGEREIDTNPISMVCMMGKDVESEGIPLDVFFQVHGGLTFAAGCKKDASEESGICHKPATDEPDDVWWLGFDCAHLGDHSPKFHNEWRSYSNGDTYRTLAFVESECARLAKQIALLGV